MTSSEISMRTRRLFLYQYSEHKRIGHAAPLRFKLACADAACSKEEGMHLLLEMKKMN